jgi:hypothetical protein
MDSRTKRNLVYFCNGDFSGDVAIRDNSTGEEMSVPSEDLIALVAEHVRSEKISKLENMSDAEILGI